MDAVTVDDVVARTDGRLADDDLTEAILARALAICRTWCGWHVTPERDEELVVDGPGGYILDLPTMRLVDISEFVEDGVDLDPDTELDWSRKGLVRKVQGGLWTDTYSGIVTTVTHGYTSAPDFVEAVLQVVDRIDAQSNGGNLRRVDDVEYFPNAGMDGLVDRVLLGPFRLEPLA